MGSPGIVRTVSLRVSGSAGAKSDLLDGATYDNISRRLEQTAGASAWTIRRANDRSIAYYNEADADVPLAGGERAGVGGHVVVAASSARCRCEPVRPTDGQGEGACGPNVHVRPCTCSPPSSSSSSLCRHATDEAIPKMCANDRSIAYDEKADALAVKLDDGTGVG
jgi:hypothetical protein